MAMNIYGRPMFQGGSIRMAPRRFQEGKEVRKFEFDKPTTPLTRDIEAYIEGTGLNKHLRERLPILGKQLQILKNQKQAGYDIREDLASLSDLDLAEEYFAGTLQYLMTPPLTQEIGDALIKQFTPTDRSFDPEAARQAKRILNREQRPIPIPKPERVPTPISKPITQDSPTPTFPSDGYNEYLEFIQGLRQEESYSPDRFSYLPLDESGRLIPQSFNKGGPIRRQAGGGIEAVMPEGLGPLVEPPPMPAPPPPVEQALSEVERASSNVAEQEVGNYTANMMSGLDAAEESGDPEEAINALRGNEMPISERYEELATYVGDDDAERTPESVLLMVQPTIMLTEQGAMDSGIGSLMEGLVGDVDMQTEQGAPTPMGEGVGSLMMAQGPTDMEVGQEPPVNFNYGGPVQRFSGGTEVNSYARGFQDFLTGSYGQNPALSQTAKQYTNMYEKALYGPEFESAQKKLIADQKDAIKTRTLLSLVKAGAGLATGGSTPQGRQMSTAQQIMAQVAGIAPELQQYATDYALIDSKAAAQEAAAKGQLRVKALDKAIESTSKTPKTPKYEWVTITDVDTGKETVRRLNTDQIGVLMGDSSKFKVIPYKASSDPVVKSSASERNDKEARRLLSIVKDTNQLEKPSDRAFLAAYLQDKVSQTDHTGNRFGETTITTYKDYTPIFSIIEPYNIKKKLVELKILPALPKGFKWIAGDESSQTQPSIFTPEDRGKINTVLKEIKSPDENATGEFSLYKNLSETTNLIEKELGDKVTAPQVLSSGSALVPTLKTKFDQKLGGEMKRIILNAATGIKELHLGTQLYFFQTDDKGNLVRDKDNNLKRRVNDKNEPTTLGYVGDLFTDKGFTLKGVTNSLTAMAASNPKGGLISSVSKLFNPAAARAFRALSSSVENLLRVRTGAAAPETEVVRYALMFMPRPMDPVSVARDKVNAMADFWNEALKIAARGEIGDFEGYFTNAKDLVKEMEDLQKDPKQKDYEGKYLDLKERYDQLVFGDTHPHKMKSIEPLKKIMAGVRLNTNENKPGNAAEKENPLNNYPNIPKVGG